MDATARLPVHHGYVPSQPDPSQWALPLFDETEATGSGGGAVSTPPVPPARDPEPVTATSVATFLQTNPTVSALMTFLGLEELEEPLAVLQLTDVPTLVASLSDVGEVISALVDAGAPSTSRPLLRARFSMVVAADAKLTATPPSYRVDAKPAVPTVELLTDGERQDLTVQFERYYRQSIPTEQQPSMWLLSKVVRERNQWAPSYHPLDKVKGLLADNHGPQEALGGRMATRW